MRGGLHVFNAVILFLGSYLGTSPGEKQGIPWWRRGELSVRIIGPNNAYIDYFQNVHASGSRLTSRFGIRVEGGRCSTIATIEDGQPFTFGKDYPVPVELEALPSRVRIIIDNHLLNHPGSDLRDLLTGRKSFQAALDSQPRRVIT
jgi:hypothetical protein